MLIASTPLSDVLPVPNRYPEGVGIEIEWEDFRQREPYTAGFWRTEPDGSLRNGGVEFISIPLNGKERVDAALSELQVATDAGAFDYEATYRCGIHVHLSMTGATCGQLASFFTYYSLIEPALMAYCGEERQDNIFCVPWYHCAAQLRGPRKLPRITVRQRHLAARLLMEQGNKYMALNYLPLNTLGTVELRMAPSWRRISDIAEWVDICMALRSESMKYEQPADVLDQYEREGMDAMLDAVGLMPGEHPYAEEAVDVAYSVAGEDERAEVDEWDIPNMVLEPDRPDVVEEPQMTPRERVRTMYNLGEINVDDLMMQVGEIRAEFDDDEPDEDYEDEEI
jgi:hypothetical protein